MGITIISSTCTSRAATDEALVKQTHPIPLRALRQRAGLSIDHLAHLVGIDASTLSRAERGYRVLKPSVYKRATLVCNEAADRRTPDPAA